MEEGACPLAKFARLNIPAAGAAAEFKVELTLPATGLCSRLENVCMAKAGSTCMVALADPTYTFCPAFGVSLAP